MEEMDQAGNIKRQFYFDQQFHLSLIHIQMCIRDRPGTQLTMRTFHTGGVAGGDITQGLPRVEELFEARKPKGLAIIAEFGGTAVIKMCIRDSCEAAPAEEAPAAE